MKKYFPLLASILVFSGFLAVQVGMDLLDSSAKQTGKVKKQQLIYEEIYKQSIFVSESGKQFNLSQLKNEVVIINFWASWCRPCLAELGSLVRLQNHFPKDKLTVLTVNTDEEDQSKKIAKTSTLISKELESFPGKLTFNLPVILDKDYHWLGKFHVNSLPLTVVYANGKLVELFEGEKDFMAEEFISDIKKILEKTK